MRKAVVIITSYARSAHAFRKPVIIAMRELGYIVYVLAPDYDHETIKCIKSIGAIPLKCRMERNGFNVVNDARTVIDIYRICKRIKPNVTLTYFLKPNIWGTIGASLANIERKILLVEGLGYIFTEDTNGKRAGSKLILGWIIILLYRIVFRLSTYVGVLNCDDMHFLKVNCGLKSDKARLIGGIGVNMEEWKRSEGRQGPVTVTMVGRLLREKGIYELIDAYKYLAPRHPNVRFLIIGGNDSNPGSLTVHEVKEMCKYDNIEVLGYVEVKKYLQESNIFVLPSYREGMPRSTQEAMAMGLPVVTTDVPGCRDTVEEALNGYLVPARNSALLAHRIEILLGDTQLAEAMGAESYKIAKKKFTETRATEIIVSMLTK